MSDVLGSCLPPDDSGEWHLMKNGMWARISEYRVYRDVDVQFSDGAVAHHRSKQNFLQGKILHPDPEKRFKRSSRTVINKVGHRVVQKHGGLAECIAYRRCDDIDIMFEDGTVRTGVTFQHFQDGSVSKYGRAADCASGSIVGVRRVMNCGLEAACVSDRGYKDIDIQFSDGEVVRHASRQCFFKGSIAHPDISAMDYSTSVKNSVLGQSRRMNCGYVCKVVEYIDCRDITVEFDDGTLVAHRKLDEFYCGTIRHPNLGKSIGSSDSMAQRVLYFYMRLFYSDIGYCVKLESLKRYSKVGFETDIYIVGERVGIEFDGAVSGHMKMTSAGTRKVKAIEESDELELVFAVKDKNPNIVCYESPKIVNIRLAYTRDYDRLLSVFVSARTILQSLGVDVSCLRWWPEIVETLQSDSRDDWDALADLYRLRFIECHHL